MEEVGAGIGGVVAGIASIAAVRVIVAPAGKRAEVLFWSWALVVCTAIYVGFAYWNDPQMLTTETVGMAVYLPCTLLAVRTRSRLWSYTSVAVGWSAHALWDLAHGDGDALPLPAGHVPQWYKPMCIGYDLAVGALLYQQATK